jgi:hypothetical protein
MSEWELPKTVETQSIERVGGGGFAWESGVYDTTVKMVYLNQAASEAQSFNIILENSEGKELRESFWIRSGKTKGKKVYYDKDGKQFPLPGYSLANSLCVAATGESLAKCINSAEKKTINVWNSELKKEAPTERPVIMCLVNKPVKVAVHQVIEDKVAKGTNGQYEPTGQSRTVNNCKFFGNTAGKTAEEITKNEEATMFDKWATKNTGTVIDKSNKAKTNSAAAIMGSTPAADNSQASLFN